MDAFNATAIPARNGRGYPSVGRLLACAGVFGVAAVVLSVLVLTQWVPLVASGLRPTIDTRIHDWALTLISTAVTGLIVSELIKTVFDRDRPVWEVSFFNEAGDSFPSGHSTAGIDTSGSGDRADNPQPPHGTSAAR